VVKFKKQNLFFPHDKCSKIRLALETYSRSNPELTLNLFEPRRVDVNKAYYRHAVKKANHYSQRDGSNRI
jgi:hypothetical protein